MVEEPMEKVIGSTFSRDSSYIVDGKLLCFLTSPHFVWKAKDIVLVHEQRYSLPCRSVGVYYREHPARGETSNSYEAAFQEIKGSMMHLEGNEHLRCPVESVAE